MKLVVAVIKPFKPGEIGRGKIFVLDCKARCASAPAKPTLRRSENPHLYLYGQEQHHDDKEA